MARRHQPALLDQLDEALALDERSRRSAPSATTSAAEVNDLSKQVGQLRRAGDVAEAEGLQTRSRALRRPRAGAGQRGGRRPGRRCASCCCASPTFPHPDVPDGAERRRQPGRRRPGRPRPTSYAEHQRVPHWETAAALGILDNERAVKISGAMFTMQRGLGATLSRALCQFALDRNADAFEEIRPPSLVTDGHADRHRPAAEVRRRRVRRRARRPVVHPHRRGAADVDLRRRGARRGRAAGAVDGLHAVLPARGRLGRAGHPRHAPVARVRQGRDPRRAPPPSRRRRCSYELRDRAEALIAGLGLPYRIIEICTGDLGQSHHRSFDLEVYAPGHRPVAGGLLGRRGSATTRPAVASIRYKVGRAAAARRSPTRSTARRWPCRGCGRRSSRTFRQPDGTVAIPPALHPYMRGATVIASEPTSPASAQEYETAGLDVADVVADPIEQWHRWYGEAVCAGCTEPHAFVLGTVDADGFPQSRYLLARGADERGFVFFTNYDSAKSAELAVTGKASMLFTWLQLHRQLRVVGTVDARVGARRATSTSPPGHVARRSGRGPRRSRRRSPIVPRWRPVWPSSSRPSPPSTRSPARRSGAAGA